MVPVRADRMANIDNFKSCYGDYYIGALILGADNSVMLSSNISNTQSTESLSVKVEVKVFGIGGSIRAHKDWSDNSHTAGMRMVGFDSLEGKVESTPPDTLLDTEALLRLVDQAHTLETRVKQALNGITLIDGGQVSEETCAALCRSGLVVSIVLIPFAKNESYITAWYRR